MGQFPAQCSTLSLMIYKVLVLSLQSVKWDWKLRGLEEVIYSIFQALPALTICVLGKVCHQDLPAPSLRSNSALLGATGLPRRSRKRRNRREYGPFLHPHLWSLIPSSPATLLLHPTPNFALQDMWPGHCRVSPGCKLECNLTRFLVDWQWEVGEGCLHACRALSLPAVQGLPSRCR